MCNAVCSGAMMQCSFGLASSTLMVMPANRCVTKMPFANVMDNKPLINILPFGMCSSAANPAVIANYGNPAACMPNTTLPWTPGSPTVQIGGFPALNSNSVLTCIYGGVIQITNEGQTSVIIS